MGLLRQGRPDGLAAAEDHKGGVVGQTFGLIMAEEFADLREMAIGSISRTKASTRSPLAEIKVDVAVRPHRPQHRHHRHPG